MGVGPFLKRGIISLAGFATQGVSFKLWGEADVMAIRGGHTIFVLDDDHEQAELLADALLRRYPRTRAFSDPIQALLALKSSAADLLIADLSMPWIDGEEVVANALAHHPGLKVILVSGFQRGAAIAKRFNIPFFHKPIDLDGLHALITRTLVASERPQARS
jgi:DNA-binding NtrC family response regulator